MVKKQPGLMTPRAAANARLMRQSRCSLIGGGIKHSKALESAAPRTATWTARLPEFKQVGNFISFWLVLFSLSSMSPLPFPSTRNLPPHGPRHTPPSQFNLVLRGHATRVNLQRRLEKQWRQETSEESSSQEEVTENLDLSASSDSDLSLSPEKPGIKARSPLLSAEAQKKKEGRRSMFGRLGSKLAGKPKRASRANANGAGDDSDDDF